jgi:hypothetical protein
MKAASLMALILVNFFYITNVQAQDENPFYPETDRQFKIYSDAIESAEKNQNPVVFVLGMKTCVWCNSLGKLIISSELGSAISEVATIQPLNLMGDAQKVVDSLKLRAGMTEKIPGYPFLFVFDPVSELTIGIRLAEFENNIPEEGIYTHHPEMVLKAIHSALGIPYKRKVNASKNMCSEFLAESI